jgi:hypothetical protein
MAGTERVKSVGKKKLSAGYVRNYQGVFIYRAVETCFPSSAKPKLPLYPESGRAGVYQLRLINR